MRSVEDLTEDELIRMHEFNRKIEEATTEGDNERVELLVQLKNVVWQQEDDAMLQFMAGILVPQNK